MGLRASLGFYGRGEKLSNATLPQVGALVWGTVRRVEPFGLFLGLDKLRMSALLHISNMSRAHVSDPEVCARAARP